MLADSAGNVFITEEAQNRIRKVAPDGTISVYAGNGVLGYTGDNGPATNASLNFPTFLTIGPDGSLFFSDALNNAIRKIDSAGVITTYAASTTHLFDTPAGIAFDGAGNLILADHFRVQRRSSTNPRA